MFVDGKEYPVTNIVNGTGSVVVPKVEAGIHTAYATVSDDPKYNDGTSQNKSFDVEKVSDYNIVVDVDPGMAGENSIVTVTVPADVTGEVTVVLDGKEYRVTPVNGIAILEVPLDAGEHVAYASIRYDPKYADKNSNNDDFEVDKASADISISVIPGKDGEDSVINVKVPVDAKGTVVITVDGKEYKVSPVNGIATLKLPLGPGEHDVTARLIDDPKYVDSDPVDDVIPISDKDKGDNGPSKQSTKHNQAKHDSAKQNHAQHNLSDYPTGNPILVLLLALLSMGVVPFRKIRK